MAKSLLTLNTPIQAWALNHAQNIVIQSQKILKGVPQKSIYLFYTHHCRGKLRPLQNSLWEVEKPIFNLLFILPYLGPGSLGTDREGSLGGGWQEEALAWLPSQFWLRNDF